MKKIWIYFSSDEKFWYPFNIEEYLESYYNIVKDIELNNKIEVYIVRWNLYESKWVFSNSYRFDFTKEKIDIYESWKIKVDLIFNRDNENTIQLINDCKIINNMEFDNLCVDKLKTYKKFPKISPKTCYINSYSEFLEKVEEFEFQENDMIVLKKNFETEWKWIFIWEAGLVTEKSYLDWNDILFQEFIDSSVWISWIVDWLHDIRLSIINWKIINSIVRKPKEWSYLANISQWWSSQMVSIDKIPNELVEISLKIMDWIKKYTPYLVSVDFMNSKNWFKLVELNSRPWLLHPNWSKNYLKFNNAIKHMLIDWVK